MKDPRHSMHRILCALVGMFAFWLPLQANASILLDEDFTGVVIGDSLTANPQTNANVNTWIDFPATLRWGITSGGICAAPCDGEFAQHLIQTSDQTNLLFYVIDTDTLFEAGTNLEISLDYIASNLDGRLIVAGMIAGTHALDPFAPWFDDETDALNNAGAFDGIVQLNEVLAQTSSWMSSPVFSFALTQQFDALVVGVIMGGSTSGSRGVDNILLQTVPLPGTIGLVGLGLGLLAAVAFRRRRQGK